VKLAPTSPRSNWPPELPPGGSSWIECLRWLISVMNLDDRSLTFAGCFRHALEHEGALSGKQHAACHKVFERIVDRWEQGTLDCQHLSAGHPLAAIEPEGTA
jgi:hypothetical protein